MISERRNLEDVGRDLESERQNAAVERVREREREREGGEGWSRIIESRRFAPDRKGTF